MSKKEDDGEFKKKSSELTDLLIPPGLRRIGPPGKRNIDTLKPFMDRSTPCVHTNSIAKDMEAPPQKKFVVTRAYRLKQFLWHEFFNEYLFYTDRLNKLPTRDFLTEYSQEFGGNLVPRNEEIDLELEQKYPLYGSNAISLWNKNGDQTCTFRRSYSITKPLNEQDQQFG